MTNEPSEDESNMTTQTPQNRAKCADAVSGQSDPVRESEWDRAVREFGEEWDRAVREFGEAARRVGELVGSLRRAGVVGEVPPVDPRERALWLRRHRGTGPGRPVQEQRRRRR